MAKQTHSIQDYPTIMKDIRGGRLLPVYLLMGTENYYIDRIAEAVIEASLTEEERDFNMHIFYGGDNSISDVIQAARSFPMGAERSLIILKEAQSMNALETLETYLRQPQPSTILLVIYRNGKADSRKKWVSLAADIGVVYESVRLREDQLPALVRSYAQEKGHPIDNKSTQMISESIGADLSRLYGELDKLFLALPAGQPVTCEAVKRNIGISKDFNTFEFLNALVERNPAKAFRIVKYFNQNPKQNPIQKTLPVLYGFFSQLMMAYYAPARTSTAIATYIGVQEWQARRNILPAMNVYSARKVLDILKAIREADEQSKGIGGARLTQEDILKQLTAFILDTASPFTLF